MKPLTADLLQTYLGRKLPQWTDIAVENLFRLPLGASRETFRFDLRYMDENGHAQRTGMILRRDPPASNVESDRAHEFAAYRAIHGHGVPVPRMILLEQDASHFDGAISLAEDLRGYHNSEYQLQDPAWADRLPHVARQMWSTMGRLAAISVAALDLSFTRAATVETTAAQELASWVDVLDRHDVGAEPITRAAIRALERWQPTAQKLAMVHGDFRAGNFLYNDDGDLIAVLDWEMAHLGDPLEDLGWSLMRVFCFARDNRYCGLATRDQAIAIWEEASGLTADPRSLRWWELFNCVKGQAIWNSSAHVWQSGANRDVIQAYAAWWLRNAQDRAMLELMDKLA
ncbi:MAG: phosphotransferase family protein [Novosphingobium sp.]